MTTDIVQNFFAKGKYGPLIGKYHSGLKDTDTGLYKCPYCDFAREKQSTVSEHITRLHPVEAGRAINQFNCDYCGDIFRSKSQMNIHISNHHEIKMIECPHKDCDYKGKQKTTVYNHYGRIHMDQGLIIEEDKATGMWRCKCCNKEYRFVSIFYHVATCNPASPFYKG